MIVYLNIAHICSLIMWHLLGIREPPKLPSWSITAFCKVEVGSAASRVRRVGFVGSGSSAVGFVGSRVHRKSGLSKSGSLGRVWGAEPPHGTKQYMYENA